MNTILVTLLITFILISAAMLLLGISWFFTGKSRFRTGMCGKVPGQNDDSCPKDISCGLCGRGGEEEETD